MKFTILLRRDATLMELLDDGGEHYIANPDKDFATMKEAASAARLEVAKADAGDINARSEGAIKMDIHKLASNYYTVIAVFEGLPKILAYPDVTMTEAL